MNTPGMQGVPPILDDLPRRGLPKVNGKIVSDPSYVSTYSIV